MCKGIRNLEEQVILEMRDVTYCYEGETLPVWKHLSCCFYKGKIHAISGPSGCGKSSILYLLDGLVPHMYEGELDGKLLLKGEEVTDLPPRDRCDRISFVMQNPESQFCTFTVEEELAFGMENLGVRPELMGEKIQKALAFVGMSGFEKTDLNNLSGGQKQKIAIASLLVTEPEILLLDEPTANLDPESRRQIFDLILRLSREEGITIILVEHNIAEIIDQVDHVLALDGSGHVTASGTREEVMREGWKVLAEDRIERRAVDLSTEEEILRIEGCKFAYPIPGKRKKDKETGKQILKGLDLSVRRQEFLAIVGENGVGKTTLMRLIFRINTQEAGTIHLFGRPIESYRKKELYHLIGLVFQNPENQFIKNTVYEELMFSLKRVRISDEEKERRVQEMLEKFHLDQEKEKSPFVLSQGQKRRLSVADMLLTNQKILFLDEPTYGQDFENRQELMKDMQKLVEEGITIVMITHDLSLVRQYATRVVELEDGRVKQDLPAEDYFTWREAKRERGDETCSRT